MSYRDAEEPMRRSRKEPEFSPPECEAHHSRSSAVLTPAAVRPLPRPRLAETDRCDRSLCASLSTEWMVSQR
jgi:hypothetical protein